MHTFAKSGFKSKLMAIRARRTPITHRVHVRAKIWSTFCSITMNAASSSHFWERIQMLMNNVNVVS